MGGVPCDKGHCRGVWAKPSLAVAEDRARNLSFGHVQKNKRLCCLVFRIMYDIIYPYYWSCGMLNLNELEL